jgi:hypothetical protein
MLHLRPFVKKLRTSVGTMEGPDDATLVLHDFENTVGRVLKISYHPNAVEIAAAWRRGRFVNPCYIVMIPIQLALANL